MMNAATGSGNGAMNETATRATARSLRKTVEAAAPRLRDLGDEAARRPRAPGKWSAGEVIGHLIDSAAHNHVRFVHAQIGDDLAFPGYPQDDFVRVERYGEAPWAELVELWRLYNLHIARVMESAPSSVCRRAAARHNFGEIAFRALPESQPATLEWLFADYVAHLEHHLAQVLPANP
jgi:DinB superfamily